MKKSRKAAKIVKSKVCLIEDKKSMKGKESASALGKIHVKINASLGKMIKASWIHKDMLYVICVNKQIIYLTKYFSETYDIPHEKVRVGSMEDLIKEISNHNTRVLISIREGKIIYDPFKFLKSLKINIEKGMMIGTKEVILKKFLLIKDYLKEIENLKRDIFDNIYTSTIEASQTALILGGHSVLIPRLIPEILKKRIGGRKMERTYIGYASEIIKMYKAYEHKKIDLPNGKKLDDLTIKAMLFREAVKKLV